VGVLSVRVVLAAVSLVLGVPAVARAAPPSPAPDPGTAGFDRDVTQLATNGHRTYVAGLFSQAFAPTAGDNLVSADSGRPLATWPDSFGLVAAVPDGGGGWFAAGGATARHLLPGGVVDAGFSAPTTDVDIKALALSPDGTTLWITGKFGSVGGQPRAGVAALRASDGTLLAWTPGASGAGWGIAATADRVDVAGYTHSGDGDGYSLAAFDAHTGALREVAIPRRPGDQGTGVVLAPGGQTVYASFNASGQGSTGAFDAATLAPRWTLQTGLPPAAIALAAGRVYLTGVGSVGGQSRDGAISVDAATGEPTGWFVPGMERGIAVAPDGAEAYFSRGQLSGWPWRGGIAASTADGALLPWNPSGTEWYAADSPAISPDGP
jgi:hypothetical protein